MQLTIIVFQSPRFEIVLIVSLSSSTFSFARHLLAFFRNFLGSDLEKAKGRFSGLLSFFPFPRPFTRLARYCTCIARF
jgi:hypothetical protein